MRLTVILLIVGIAHSAQAHGNLSHRHAAGTVRVQDGGQRTLDLMLTLSLVGPRAKLLIGRFDLDRDGHFSARETQLFQDELKKELEGGLLLRCPSIERLQPIDIKYKSSQKNSRTLLFAGLLTYILPDECASLVFESTVGAQRKGLEELKVQLSAYPPIRIAGKQRTSFQLMPGPTSVITVPLAEEF